MKVANVFQTALQNIWQAADSPKIKMTQPRQTIALAGILLGQLLGTGPAASAADWQLAPGGSAKGDGTISSPWDLESTLHGKHSVQPGDTVWFSGGTYRNPNRTHGGMGYEIRLAGSAGKPIQLRAMPAERVTLDGGVNIQSPSTFLWLRDLEIIVSENLTGSRRLEEPGSAPKSYDRPWGGLNIFYSAGPFLVGGGKPSRNIRVWTNYFYGVPARLGYNAPYNENCEVLGNVIANSNLAINNYKEVLNEGNLIVPTNLARPKGTRVQILPNQYDPRRAHIVIFNWEKNPQVELPVGDFLKRGERFRLLNPRDVFGKPAATGTYDGPIFSPANSAEFAVFILER